MDMKKKKKKSYTDMFETKKNEYAEGIGQIQSKKSKMDMRKHPFGK